MALLNFKKPAVATPPPTPELPIAPAPAPAAILAPASRTDAKRHAADDVPENFPGSYAPPSAPVVAPEPSRTTDLDPRVGRLRQSLQELLLSISAIDPPNFFCPDQADVASAPAEMLVQWARDIARNLGATGGASC